MTTQYAVVHTQRLSLASCEFGCVHVTRFRRNLSINNRVIEIFPISLCFERQAITSLALPRVCVDEYRRINNILQGLTTVQSEKGAACLLSVHVQLASVGGSIPLHALVSDRVSGIPPTS